MRAITSRQECARSHHGRRPVAEATKSMRPKEKAKMIFIHEAMHEQPQ
jgi:hypothetical protein